MIYIRTLHLLEEGGFAQRGAGRRRILDAAGMGLRLTARSLISCQMKTTRPYL